MQRGETRVKFLQGWAQRFEIFASCLRTMQVFESARCGFWGRHDAGSRLGTMWILHIQDLDDVHSGHPRYSVWVIKMSRARHQGSSLTRMVLALPMSCSCLALLLSLSYISNIVLDK